MIRGIIAPGYNISDNCHKYTNDDSTIECYVYTREALLKPIKTTDKELNTNSVYALVGTQDDEIKVYVGQGCNYHSQVMLEHYYLGHEMSKEVYFEHIKHVFKDYSLKEEQQNEW